MEAQSGFVEGVVSRLGAIQDSVASDAAVMDLDGDGQITRVYPRSGKDVCFVAFWMLIS